MIQYHQLKACEIRMSLHCFRSAMPTLTVAYVLPLTRFPNASTVATLVIQVGETGFGLTWGNGWIQVIFFTKWYRRYLGVGWQTCLFPPPIFGGNDPIWRACLFFFSNGWQNHQLENHALESCIYCIYLLFKKASFCISIYVEFRVGGVFVFGTPRWEGDG